LLWSVYVLYNIGEYRRDPKPDLSVLERDMPAAVQPFQKALELDYSGRHLIGSISDRHLLGILGITTVHAGQMSNNPTIIAQGDQTLVPIPRVLQPVGCTQ
jgi:hypothetical protein